MARWRAEVSTHVESVQGGIYRSMADYSRIPENLDAYPFAVMSVFFHAADLHTVFQAQSP